MHFYSPVSLCVHGSTQAVSSESCLSHQEEKSQTVHIVLNEVHIQVLMLVNYQVIQAVSVVCKGKKDFQPLFL